MTPPPYTPIEAITEVLHGIPVTDPYRWLEDQHAPRTREWLRMQHEYARSYLDAIPDRNRIRDRIRELVDVETYDSIQQVGSRYFFRKRERGQEQPCIFVRDGIDGEDQLLINPAERGTGSHTAVKPLRASPDGSLLLYELKEGGERTSTLEIIDVQQRKILPDVLPRGYLRGFVFSPDSRSFYYSHESLTTKKLHYHAAYRHILGTSFDDDQEIFFAGGAASMRLCMLSGLGQIGFLVYHFLDKTLTDFYLGPLGSDSAPEPIVRKAEYKFGPWLLKDGGIVAVTDSEAPNFKIVEVRPMPGREPEFIDLVPESKSTIQSWTIAGQRMFVSYLRDLKTEIAIFDLSGKPLGYVPVESSNTVRLLAGTEEADELFFEQESFTKPIQICSYSPKTSETKLLANRAVPFHSADFDHTQVWFTAKDGTRIPMFLVGRRNVLNSGQQPTIMTSYGGYGVSMTPQFTVFVAFLMERGCLFALPNIRGGSEFGAKWHSAAKRRKRQVAINDFLSAAQWLIESGRTESGRLAIFGGSNSGLLVGAALTQRSDLFRAVVCMVPMLDMLRYHLFDNSHVWKEEFGTADDAEDFAALFNYSPYQNVRDGNSYPATMIVSGDADKNCNPLHARKMTARLQAANAGDQPIFLDYSQHRGHAPVLPLSERIDALTDRMAFLCDQLQLPV
jgi:prolyl oligopeptidase